MANTTITLGAAEVEQVERLAHEMNLSSNQLIAAAIQEYVQRHTLLSSSDAEILNRINASYPDLDEDERKQMAAIQDSQRRLVEGEWQGMRFIMEPRTRSGA